MPVLTLWSSAFIKLGCRAVGLYEHGTLIEHLFQFGRRSMNLIYISITEIYDQCVLPVYFTFINPSAAGFLNRKSAEMIDQYLLCFYLGFLRRENGHIRILVIRSEIHNILDIRILLCRIPLCQSSCP